MSQHIHSAGMVTPRFKKEKKEEERKRKISDRQQCRAAPSVQLWKSGEEQGSAAISLRQNTISLGAGKSELASSRQKSIDQQAAVARGKTEARHLMTGRHHSAGGRRSVCRCV